MLGKPASLGGERCSLLSLGCSFMLQSWTARLEELGSTVCQGEVRSADLILHLLIHSLTHLTLALSRMLGRKTPQSILLKILRGTVTC